MNSGMRYWGWVIAVASVLALVGVERALSCWGPTFDSVHFNSEVPDFGVPPQDVVAPTWRNAPLRPGSHNMDDHWSERRAREQNTERLAGLARKAEGRRRYRVAIAIYGRLRDRDLGEPAFWQDRIEVLTQALKAGRPRQWASYVGARNVYESDDACAVDLARVRRKMQTIAADPRAGFLRAHALYTIAALGYDGGRDRTPADLFERCADAHPRSARAESALIMAVRTLLEERPSPIDDRSRAEARRLIAKLLSTHPKTRFKADAIGWLGRVDYLEGRFDKALADYRRQLKLDRSDFGAYDSIAECELAKGRGADAFAWYLRAFLRADKEAAAEALCSLEGAFKPKETARLAVMLRDEPDLLQPYLEFRLHLTETSPGDLANLVALSERCLMAHPATRLSAPILARLAEISYVGKRFASARRFAQRSLRTPGEGHDLALFVYAAGSNRMGEYAAAAREFRRLIREQPGSTLVGGARENLALACEKIGRLCEALDQYYRLHYAWDVAYMLDVRMTPAQIERFIDDYPGHKLRPQAIYTLGLRYLRKERFAAAERAFGRLSRRKRLALAEVARHRGEDSYDREDSPLYDPLRTAHDLARLQHTCRSARGPERKARALYAWAAYYHDRGNLLLYNPSLWEGCRAMSYQISWNRNVATQADTVAWRTHCYEHESLARARALCLEIVSRYPRSSVAAKAAYTAAVACFKLGGFNEWWREEDDRVGLSKQAVRLMKLVVARYPKSPLAKAAAKYADVYLREAAERGRDSWFYDSK